MCVCVCVCVHVCTISVIDKYTLKNIFDKIFFFLHKYTKVLLFLVEHYTIKIDIIKYYLLPMSTTLKLCSQKYEHLVVKKWDRHGFTAETFLQLTMCGPAVAYKTTTLCWLDINAGIQELNSMNHSKNLISCWIPSHIEIQGNDKTDSLVKVALNMVPDKKSNLYTDLKLKIRQIITKKWQQLWDKNPHNKLFQVQSIKKKEAGYQKRRSHSYSATYWTY